MLGPSGSRDTVVFNVGGRLFEVLLDIIESRPYTLLAILLNDADQRGKPIFVDANPDRFAHILDWYRYGEMYSVGDCALGGILRDARYFMLSDAVTINGHKHRLPCDTRAPSYLTAPEVADIAKDSVLSGWPAFESYVDELIGELRQTMERFHMPWVNENEELFAQGSSQHPYWYDDTCIATVARDDQAWDWVDSENLNSHGRLGVLLAELKQRGFECSVLPRYASYADQQVTLRVGVRLDGLVGVPLPQPIVPLHVAPEGFNVHRLSRNRRVVFDD